MPLTDNPESPRVILIRPGCFDPSLYSIQDAMKVSTMMQDIMINEDDSFVISGQIGILDLSGVNVGHFMQFSPTFVKKMTVMTQDSSPIRQKGLHWINTPRGFESVFNIFTAFMNEKNRSRVSSSAALFSHTMFIISILLVVCSSKLGVTLQTCSKEITANRIRW